MSNLATPQVRRTGAPHACNAASPVHHPDSRSPLRDLTLVRATRLALNLRALAAGCAPQQSSLQAQCDDSHGRRICMLHAVSSQSLPQTML